MENMRKPRTPPKDLKNINGFVSSIKIIRTTHTCDLTSSERINKEENATFIRSDNGIITRKRIYTKSLKAKRTKSYSSNKGKNIGITFVGDLKRVSRDKNGK